MSDRTEKRIIKARDKAVASAEKFSEAYQDMLNAFYELGHVTGYAGHPSTLPFPKPEPRREFDWRVLVEQDERHDWEGDDS